jgi:hypothetical protein
MAIRESENEMLLLSDIYQWIADHYAYYSNTTSNWRNSVRHNLSTNKHFLKVTRKYGQPGRGGFWTIRSESKHRAPDRCNEGVCGKTMLHICSDDDDNDHNHHHHHHQYESSSSCNRSSKKRVKSEKLDMQLTESKDLSSTGLNMWQLRQCDGNEGCHSEEAIPLEVILRVPFTNRLNTLEGKKYICRPERSTGELEQRSSSPLKLDEVNGVGEVPSLSSSGHRCQEMAEQKPDSVYSQHTDQWHFHTEVEDLNNCEEICSQSSFDCEDVLLSDSDPYWMDFPHLLTTLPLDLTTNDKVNDDVAYERFGFVETCTDASDDDKDDKDTNSAIDQSSTWADHLLTGDNMLDLLEKHLANQPDLTASYSQHNLISSF